MFLVYFNILHRASPAHRMPGDFTVAIDLIIYKTQRDSSLVHGMKLISLQFGLM